MREYGYKSWYEKIDTDGRNDIFLCIYDDGNGSIFVKDPVNGSEDNQIELSKEGLNKLEELLKQRGIL